MQKSRLVSPPANIHFFIHTLAKISGLSEILGPLETSVSLEIKAQPFQEKAGRRQSHSY